LKRKRPETQKLYSFFFQLAERSNRWQKMAAPLAQVMEPRQVKTNIWSVLTSVTRQEPNFLTKVAQISGYILGYFENHYYLRKNCSGFFIFQFLIAQLSSPS